MGDDLLITGQDAGDIKEFKLEMLQQFRMSDLGLLSYYLGIGVRQDHNGISLSLSLSVCICLEALGEDRDGGL